MDLKNLNQFIPGYHSIDGSETIRITTNIDDVLITRHCLAQDSFISSLEKCFILGKTKRQFDRWHFPLSEEMIIQDFQGSYRVTHIEYQPISSRNAKDKDSGIPICYTERIADGLSESAYIFSVLHQVNPRELEMFSEELLISGIMASSGNPSVKTFQAICLDLPLSSHYDKAFLVLEPNNEIKRRNLLLGTFSKIDSHGEQYQTDQIDFMLRPTYPILLTRKISCIAA